MKMKLSLYTHTILHLKGKQIVYQLWYLIRKRVNNKKYTLPKEISGSPLILIPFINKPKTLFPDSSFCFLHITDTFRSWHDKENSKLWRYNLYYMDYLLQEDISFENKKEWINSFIDGLPLNQEGLEAYPTALRCMNWIKFISINPYSISNAEKNKWDQSLYRQYVSLYHNLEFHLLGNHLLEDAFSLLWGGLYFTDRKLYDKSVHLLIKELNEQILPDGAHYELSPMYHTILLDRLLDCINALKHNHSFQRQEYVTSFLEEKARLMLSWLKTIIYKDGTIPLVNDAAYEIAPTPRKIFHYADLLGLRWSSHKLKECGYRKFTSDIFEMVLDVGHIGPDYIPGHAHADTFSYELRIKEKPFIIDSGISTYDKNPRRQYERETQAHNTVQVEGLSSSNVWGGFRVAQRAKITSLKEDHNSITARHNGFKRLGIEHQRIFDLSKEEIMICDSLQPLSDKKGINTIIFHPDVRIHAINQDTIHTNMASLSFYGTDEIWIEDCEVAFEYNQLIATKKIRIAFTNQMQYKLVHNQ